MRVGSRRNECELTVLCSIAWGLDTGYGFVLQNGTVLGKQPEGCS